MSEELHRLGRKSSRTLHRKIQREDENMDGLGARFARIWLGRRNQVPEAASSTFRSEVMDIGYCFFFQFINHQDDRTCHLDSTEVCPCAHFKVPRQRTERRPRGRKGTNSGSAHMHPAISPAPGPCSGDRRATQGQFGTCHSRNNRAVDGGVALVFP